MAVSQEQDPKSLREMTFYGKEVAELLRDDVKLLTLRKPNPKYDFETGEVILANCSDSGIKIRLVVIDNMKKPLYEYSELELALDGYDGVYQAARDLRTYPGYGDVDTDSEIQGILTMTEELFLSLPEEMREDLIHRGVNAMLDVDQPYREIFWPAWCRWVIAGGGEVMDWRYFLIENELAYEDETPTEYDEIGNDELLTIWEDREGKLYRQVVLMEVQ